MQRLPSRFFAGSLERGGLMGREEAVRQAVGKADAYELLSCLFAYPDERVANGLVDGLIAEDARACLLDAGIAEDEVHAVGDALGAWRGASAADVLSAMRIAYSHLYLAPGGHTPVQPYESAFLHVERGLSGIPSLFRTPVTMDVERCMREAGVVAKNARKEPCDSVFEEFEFLSYLYAKLADALSDDDAEDATTAVAGWTERLRAFEDEHALAWLPAFMRRTQELAEDGPYAAFAALGLTAMGVRS